MQPFKRTTVILVLAPGASPDLREELEGAGFVVLTVTEPCACVAAAAADQDAFVVVDYDLPGGLGPALLQHLADHRPTRDRIVVLTEATSARAAIRIFRQGATDAVLKPVNGAELVAVLERLLRMTRRTSANDTVAAASPPLAVAPPPAPIEGTTRIIPRRRPRWAALRAEDGPLPPLHPRLADARDLLVDLDAPVERVIRLTESDPTLASRLLRVANSSFFRGARASTNIREACVRLGNRPSAGILLEAMLDQTLRPPDARLGRVFETSWGVAVLAARIARTLAPAVGIRKAEELYVATLLHNVGETVLLWRLGVDLVTNQQPLGAALDEAAYWIDEGHEAAGRSFADVHRLPPLVGILAGNHHGPRASETSYDRSLRLLTLAAWSLARDAVGPSLPTRHPADASPHLIELAVPADRLAEVQAHVDEWLRTEGAALRTAPTSETADRRQVA